MRVWIAALSTLFPAARRLVTVFLLVPEIPSKSDWNAFFERSQAEMSMSVAPKFVAMRTSESAPFCESLTSPQRNVVSWTFGPRTESRSCVTRRSVICVPEMSRKRM
eukprot:Amastigsp_a508827_6.p3 type:complete len:107 gc:universal Amastigsp_a508827_6:429-749(+)